MKLVTPTAVTNVSAKVKVKTRMSDMVRVSFKSMRDVLKPSHELESRAVIAVTVVSRPAAWVSSPSTVTAPVRAAGQSAGSK